MCDPILLNLIYFIIKKVYVVDKQAALAPAVDAAAEARQAEEVATRLVSSATPTYS